MINPELDIKSIKEELENEYYTQESISPDDELLYQSKIDQADAPSLKELVVGKEFDGDEILKRGWGKTLYDMTYRLATDGGLSEAFTEEEPEDYTWFEGLLERGLTLGAELPIYGGSFLAGDRGILDGSTFRSAPLVSTRTFFDLRGKMASRRLSKTTSFAICLDRSCASRISKGDSGHQWSIPQ